MDKKSFTYDVRKPKKGGILEMADWEAQSESCQTSKIKRFAKIVNGF